MKKIHSTAFFSRFDPEEKSKKYGWILTGVTLLMLLLASGCLGAMSLYFSTGSYKLPLFFFYMENFKLVLLNILPFQLLCLLIWFLTNRAWVGFLGSGVFCLVYSFAEYWKLMARDDPIFAEDLLVLKEALQMSGSYVEVTWQMIFAIFLVLLGTAVIFLFFRGKLPRVSLRIALPVAVVIAGVLLYNGPYTSKEVYSSFKVWERVNPWFQNNNYISRGGIYPFIYSIQSALPQVPADYSKEEAAEQLGAYKHDAIPEDKKVSVVAVMYEAFADLTLDTDRITGADPYAGYHQLQSEGYSGELVTNIFAGGTINTERCVLTGFSELTSFRRQSWSYARYFAEQGYTVEGAHAGYQAFYNRLNVNRNLGIEDYKFIENYFSDLFEGIPKDRDFLPEITRLTKEKTEAGEKVFSFNVTYQNHGPYSTDRIYSEKIYVPQNDLSDYDYNVVNNYLSGVEDTSNRMLEMADAFRDSKEPVVLVFFGDHKPWLGDSSTTYTALGIDLFANNEESFYNYYNTEYLIWANDAAKEVLGKEFSGKGPAISPCYLMNLLFEQCGWEGPSYLKMSNEIKAELPVVTTNDRYLVDGALVPTSSLTEEQKAMLEKMRRVQFYLSRDSGGKLP
ncbi:MAG: sulfatase-like hydrolase/transferase [Clostridia bacterium]|nr:sulfatase-like hydrolase/transferase [Clostridia bacterium]